MPNWCEGILKLRGNKKDLVNFVMNVLERYVYKSSSNELCSVEVSYDDFGELEIELNDDSYIYFKNSRRVFLTQAVSWYFNTKRDDPDGEQYIQLLDIKQAWDIDTDYFVKLSMLYRLDIKIDAFELGMQFTRHIEIIQGDIVRDDTQKYNNYDWEVYDPRLGG